MWTYTFGIGALCATGVCHFTNEEMIGTLGRDFTVMLLIQFGKPNDPTLTPAQKEKG